MRVASRHLHQQKASFHCRWWLHVCCILEPHFYLIFQCYNLLHFCFLCCAHTTLNFYFVNFLSTLCQGKGKCMPWHLHGDPMLTEGVSSLCLLCFMGMQLGLSHLTISTLIHQVILQALFKFIFYHDLFLNFKYFWTLVVFVERK